LTEKATFSHRRGSPKSDRLSMSGRKTGFL
jgi:hypothetical protein